MCLTNLAFPAPQQEIPEKIRKRLLLELATSDTFPDTDFKTDPVPFDTFEPSGVFTARIRNCLMEVIPGASNTSRDQRLEAYFKIMRLIDSTPQDQRDSEQHRHRVAQAACLKTTLYITSQVDIAKLARLTGQDPVPSPEKPLAPSKAMILGYPELYQLHKEPLLAIRNIFRASVTVAACVRTLGLWSERAQFVFICAMAESAALPWPAYDPAKIPLGNPEVRQLASTYALEPKIAIAADPNSSFHIVHLASTVHRSLHRHPAFAPEVSEDDEDNVKELWACEIAQVDHMAKNSAIVRLLKAFTGPLRKISELDKLTKGSIYHHIAKHALLSVIPRDLVNL